MQCPISILDSESTSFVRQDHVSITFADKEQSKPKTQRHHDAGHYLSRLPCMPLNDQCAPADGGQQRTCGDCNRISSQCCTSLLSGKEVRQHTAADGHGCGTKESCKKSAYEHSLGWSADAFNDRVKESTSISFAPTVPKVKHIPIKYGTRDGILRPNTSDSGANRSGPIPNAKRN